MLYFKVFFHLTKILGVLCWKRKELFVFSKSGDRLLMSVGIVSQNSNNCSFVSVSILILLFSKVNLKLPLKIRHKIMKIFVLRRIRR